MLFHTKKKKKKEKRKKEGGRKEGRKEREVMDVSINSMGEILSQWIHVSNYHIYLKILKLHLSIIPQ